MMAIGPGGRLSNVHAYQSMLAMLKHRSDYDVSEYSDELGRVIIGVIGHHDLIGAPQRFGATVVASYGQLRTRPEDVQRTDPLVRSRFEPTGNFSVAQYAPSDGTLSLKVDRYASEPIFYATVEGVLYFAPEVKALLTVPRLDRQIDFAALASFLGSGHFLGDQTLLSNVRKLPGGQELYINSDGLRRSSYWRFEPGKNYGHESCNSLSHDLGKLIEESMGRLFQRREDELIFLSGGLDSRTILAAALKAAPSGTPIRTVSWGAESSIAGSDQQIAASIAARYGLEHHFMRRRTERYGDNVWQTLHIIDGQCDVPCMHPGEYEILASFEHMGVRKVFRGDEAFGWRARVYSHLGGLSHVGIKRFSSLPLLRKVLLSKCYERCCDAGDAAFDALLHDCQQWEPNDAKDRLYFSHRLQNYLGPASYYKRILFKQLDPLLCDEILDFMSLVPRSMRFEKAILYSALHRINPQLAQFPYATHSGLESWAQEMATPGTVRTFLDMQVHDEGSEIWSIFDRNAVSEQLAGFKRSPRTPLTVALMQSAKQTSKRLMNVISPKSTAELIARRAQTYLPANVLLMRFVVLKFWFDELLNRS
jgi:hypothetical protein